MAPWRVAALLFFAATAVTLCLEMDESGFPSGFLNDESGFPPVFFPDESRVSPGRSKAMRVGASPLLGSHDGGGDDDGGDGKCIKGSSGVAAKDGGFATLDPSVLDGGGDEDEKN